MPSSFPPSLQTDTPTGHRIMLGVLLMTTLSIAGAVALQAQPVPPASVPAKNATSKNQKTPIDVVADVYSNIDSTKVQTLSGNVRLTSENTVLRTDLVQYNHNTDVAVSPGKIVIDDGDNTITGNAGKAYYQAHTAIIQGNVKILVRPRKADAGVADDSARSQFREPVTISCDRVDFDWRTRVAVITGHLTLKQVTGEGVTRTATAQKLVYQATPEIATLSGDVHAEDTHGQQVEGPIATLNLKKGAEGFTMGDTSHRGVHGKFYLNNDQDTASGANGANGTKEGFPPPPPETGTDAPPPSATPTPTPTPIPNPK